jgi:excisionase family DNA binding protein
MQLFTIPELANLMNMSRQRVWQLVKDSSIPAKKVGGVYIIRESEIPNKYLEKCRSESLPTSKEKTNA